MPPAPPPGDYAEMAGIRHTAYVFARCVIRAGELSRSSPPFLNPRPDQADQETMTVRAPARHGRLVEPDGRAAPRLATAISRDPGLGRTREAMAFRSLPRARAVTTMP